MASERLTPALIIDEPSTPGTPSPASLVTSSPETTSSPNSYSSSRPPSQVSSQTSVSGPPSPQEGQSGTVDHDVSQDAIEMQSLTPSTLNIPSPGISPASSHITSQTDPARLIPSPSATDTSNSRQETDHGRQDSWFRIVRRKIHERRWLENTIGVLSVITALWLGVRGYKLAVWQSWNDLRQTCAAYKQVGSSRSLFEIRTHVDADQHFFGS